MTVYGDLLFLINFSMDFLCFYLSCLLLRERLNTLRACIASVIGGVYSVAVLFMKIEGILTFVIDILALILMCFIVYGIKRVNAKRLLKRIGLYFVVSSILGGFMTAVFSLLNSMEILGENSGMEDGIDIWIFAFLALISSILTLKGGSIFRTSGLKREAIVEIFEENKTLRLRALIDTGNLVCEPISGKSVMFAKLDSFKGMLNERDYNSLKNGDGIEEMPISLAMRVRPIFAQSIGGSNLLTSVRFKNVYLIYGKRKKELDVYIALVQEGISGEYDAIISSELIT